VSGSGISWAVCKSAPRCRQTTTPAPHRSVFYRPDALPATVSKHWRHAFVLVFRIFVDTLIDWLINWLSDAYTWMLFLLCLIHACSGFRWKAWTWVKLNCVPTGKFSTIIHYLYLRCVDISIHFVISRDFYCVLVVNEAVCTLVEFAAKGFIFYERGQSWWPQSHKCQGCRIRFLKTLVIYVFIKAKKTSKAQLSSY